MLSIAWTDSIFILIKLNNLAAATEEVRDAVDVEAEGEAEGLV